ncbi:hypothetical protein CALCODRAFT_513642, partial [Calocera cornea HHB12733]
MQIEDLATVATARKTDMIQSLREHGKERFARLQAAVKGGEARLNVKALWDAILSLPCEQLASKPLSDTARPLVEGSNGVVVSNNPYRIDAIARLEPRLLIGGSTAEDSRSPEASHIPHDAQVSEEEYTLFALRIRIFLLTLGISDFPSAMTRFWMEASRPSSFHSTMEELLLAMCHCRVLSPSGPDATGLPA